MGADQTPELELTNGAGAAVLRCFIGAAAVPSRFPSGHPEWSVRCPTPRRSCRWLGDAGRCDKMQDSFMNTGDFFLQSGVPRVEPFEVAPRMWSLVNTLGWVVLTLIPMLYYLIGLLLSGRLLYFSISCAIFGAFYIFLQKSIAMSKISQGSSYGAEKK
ncbi:unnamed protein product [Plutella xylostella]|uniref:(diamondback moth) hypothetical protein n=1 Tax=Plutella xylostella TaxID=51655 RepID=A0A8S4EIN0_PLUXY|nr:unnamed protein product [Plutella xylostella]